MTKGNKKLVDGFGNPLVSAKPVTRHYKPIDNRFNTPIRDLPPLSIVTIEAMRREPIIKMCLPIRKAPLLKMEFAFKEGENWKPGVRCDNPAVGQFVLKQLTRIWQYVSCLLDAQIYGWAGAEVTLKLDKDTNLLEVDELIGRHARDVRLVLQDGVLNGVQFLRTLSPSGQAMPPLGFPKAVFHSHFPNAGEWYGTSALDGAYSPWWDKWMRGGGADTRRLFMHKDAYGGADLGYPQGETELPDGSIVSNKDIAREIVEQMQAGAVTTRPSETDANGKERWPLTRATVTSNPQHILQYPKDLDEEMRHGLGIFDDIVTSDSTGSWDGKSMTIFAFLGTLDEWAVQLIKDVVTYVVRPLVEINFGEDEFFEVTHKHFVDQLKAQQGEANQGAGNGGFPPANPGDRPFPGQIGGGSDQQQQGFDDGEDGDDEQVSDRMLKIAMSAIGRAVIEAKDVVRLSTLEDSSGHLHYDKGTKGGQFAPKSGGKMSSDQEYVNSLAAKVKSGAMTKSQANKQLKKEGKGPGGGQFTNKADGNSGHSMSANNNQSSTSDKKQKSRARVSPKDAFGGGPDHLLRNIMDIENNYINGKPENDEDRQEWEQIANRKWSEYNAMLEPIKSFFPEGETADIADLVGAPDTAEVKYGLDPQGSLEIEITSPDFEAIRKLSRVDGELVMENVYFKVNKTGEGLGAEIFANQVENAKRLGVSRIETHAAKLSDKGKAVFNGYYTWPRLGYDAPLASITKRGFLKKVKSDFPDANNVSDLMKTEQGRSWWKANGVDLYNAIFDLSDDSLSMKIMREYVVAKRGKANAGSN